MVTIRDAGHDDASFLQSVLGIAFNWRNEAGGLTVEEILAKPAIAHYISGWPRHGDLGVIAEDRQPIGAAWWRLLPEDDPGYGFIDAATPEISIGIVPEHRGQGIGTALLDALIAKATDLRLPALSLSVDPDNPAIRLYQRIGFEVTGGVGGSLTMRRRLPIP
jgi:ribosomal protein S18 acetylase RimI-like enzyme